MNSIIVGITGDAANDAYATAKAYTRAVLKAGGIPLILPHVVDSIPAYLAICDAFVFTGGDDPRTEEFGCPTHPKARPMDEQRQIFEVALLKALEQERAIPVLGVCLGMQLMALVHGGSLDQYLPETLASHKQHSNKSTHTITGSVGRGLVQSHHQQSVRDPGDLEVAATADDGVIEAVCDPKRVFYLGVQWHPERTDDPALGAGLFRQLVDAASELRADEDANSLLDRPAPFSPRPR